MIRFLRIQTWNRFVLLARDKIEGARITVHTRALIEHDTTRRSIHTHRRERKSFVGIPHPFRQEIFRQRLALRWDDQFRL